MNENILEIINVYIKEFADAPHGEAPELSPEITKILRAKPEEVFEIISNDLYKRPENMDLRDIGSPSGRLLTTVVDLIPELVIPKMTKGFWGTRYLYISSAVTSKSPIYISTIIDLLTDRSIYIKALILDSIIDWQHLRVPEAIPKFEKLSKMKSFQNSDIDRELLEKAWKCVVSSL